MGPLESIYVMARERGKYMKTHRARPDITQSFNKCRDCGKGIYPADTLSGYKHKRTK